MTARQDLHVQQGATFSFVYTKRDSAGSAVDLTGYTARMRIKDRINGAEQAYLTTGSDADGGTITLGGAQGTVTLAMTATQAAALAGELSASSSVLLAEHLRNDGPVVEYRYDLELVSGATVTRELEGRVLVHREITT